MEAERAVTPVEVTVTCASADEATSIARAIVEARLAACAQTWPIASCYRWDGAVVDDREHIVLLKTLDTCFDAICTTIRELHSYELPAIVMVPLGGWGPGYLEWLTESTT